MDYCFDIRDFGIEVSSRVNDAPSVSKLIVYPSPADGTVLYALQIKIVRAF
jgi:hypothetical protein